MSTIAVIDLGPRIFDPPFIANGEMGLLAKFKSRFLPGKVGFLFMDEKYLDLGASDEAQVTSLTGLLVSSGSYPALRDRLFHLLPNFSEGAGALGTEIHASSLFRVNLDEDHFEFYEGLTSLISENKCKIFRRGINFVPALTSKLREKEICLLYFCFKSMLFDALESERNMQIWPVMETDESQSQDKIFAGYIRGIDHATSYLNMVGDGVKELIDEDLMVDNGRLGGVHYFSKKSIVGNAVYCITYLLHLKWLKDEGFKLTEYKARLAEIAAGIHPSLVDEYIAPYRSI